MNDTSILWEEKNLIEPKKNFENKNELEIKDIIQNTEKECEKKECENIGNQKKWIRNCPKCKNKISYSRKDGLNVANKENRICKKCYNKVLSLQRIVGPFIKICLKCNRKQIFSRKDILDRSIKKNSLCINCKGENISKSLIGRISPMKGKTFSKEHKEKISKALKGKIISENTCKKISISHKGMKYSLESRIKRKLRRIEDLKMIGIFHPPYNKKSCEYFKQMELDKGWNGYYALNGGEYFIKDLGYWVDYYEPNQNVVIEWDEKYHYKSGKLREKDIKRQKEIEEYLGCRFYRIKELTGGLSVLDFNISK